MASLYTQTCDRPRRCFHNGSFDRFKAAQHRFDYLNVVVRRSGIVCFSDLGCGLFEFSAECDQI
jgi:hypothetical protein